MGLLSRRDLVAPVDNIPFRVLETAKRLEQIGTAGMAFWHHSTGFAGETTALATTSGLPTRAQSGDCRPHLK